MADTGTAAVPAPLLKMRSLVGTIEAPGAADNPVILGFASTIGARFPKMLKYSATYVHDSIPWCGLTVAVCMAANGIEPPFGPEDTDKFLFVDAWKTFGIGISKDAAEPGDVMVFTNGMHHVSMLDHVSGDSFVCIGGNQSDQVKLSSYPKSACTAVRRAVEVAAIPMPASASIAISKANNFKPSVAAVLEEEGGNDDDPRDPGGRTSRGILQKEWTVYIQTHPGLPTDVWKAPQADIETIYHQQYWDVVWGDELPNGIDLAIFDMAVLQGVGRVGDVQTIVGSQVDSEMGPITLAAIKTYISAFGASKLIDAICDRRLARLQGSKNWGTFGHGWSNRIATIRTKCKLMAANVVVEQPQELPVTDTPAPAPVPAPAPTAEVPAIDIKSAFAAFQKLAAELPAIFASITALKGDIEQLKGQLPAFKPIDLSGLSSGIKASMAKAALDPATGTVVAAAPTAAVDAQNKTGLGAGIIGLITALGLGAAGVTGTPVGEAATTTGQVLPLLAGGVSLLGAFGKLAPFLRAAIAIL